jgi:hypothetical protein
MQNNENNYKHLQAYLSLFFKMMHYAKYICKWKYANANEVKCRVMSLFTNYGFKECKSKKNKDKKFSLKIKVMLFLQIDDFA